MIKLNVAGFATCPWFKKAAAVVTGLSAVFPSNFSSNVTELPTRDEYLAWLDAHKPKLDSAAQSHKTSPIVWFDDGKYLGFLSQIKCSVN